ncbi:hypothetical protein [Xanthomonas campestris]|uniref:hypothetical protein n=1 Tax=Xanthomonas campestris TaxID=339 RepID=UPI0023785FE8|nr:hypothetical protein [Xanthomonas campestris]WDJ75223.1 hypothetical protein JH282_12145 [Xanthomonas campestris pv. campestris]
MAENELLDFGHRDRWKRSRLLLDDPHASLSDVVKGAGEDFAEVARRLAVALRKGQTLLTLLRAAKQSPIALQAVIANFTEKRLASLVLTASQTTQSLNVAAVANRATELIVQTLIDQIAVRALSKRRFTSRAEQAALRASLVEEFAQYRPAVRAVLEASMTGAPVKAIKRKAPTVRPTAQQVAHTSLVIRRPEDRHEAR